MFDPSTRGLANGIFSWGVYFGYGLTFILGNYFGGASWRVSFVIGCSPGLIIGILLFFVDDPRKTTALVMGEEEKKSQKSHKPGRKRSVVLLKQEKSYFKTVITALAQPTMVFLFIATSVRQRPLL